MSEFRNKKVYVIIASISLIVLCAVHVFKTQEAKRKGNRAISCRLKWHHQTQFAGAYMASEKGFLKENGLDCTFFPGGPDLNAVALVASGSDDFGIWGAESVIIGRSQGIPIVAVAVIFQKSPVCFFATKESGISDPQDFVDRTVGMQYGTNVRIEYLAMMKNANVPVGSVHEVPTRFDLRQFINEEVDVWNGYTFNEPRLIEQKGIPVTLILPSNYGVDMYADCIFTTEEMIRNNPKTVRAFVKALIAGWYYALENKNEAVQITLSMDPMLDYEHQFAMLTDCEPLIIARCARSKGIGYMEPSVWNNMYVILKTQGLLGNHPVDVNEVFTNAFLSDSMVR